MIKTNTPDTHLGLNKVGLVLMILLGGATVKQVYDAKLLARTARFTTGTVIASHCTGHASIGFTYEVGGIKYQHEAVASTCGLPGCDKTNLGASVPVIYSIEKPALATCTSLAASSAGIVNQIFVCALAAVGFGFIVWREKLSKRP